MRSRFSRKIVATHWCVGLRQAKFFARHLIGRALQKRVVIQHLVNLLAELQRGQLQQLDGLLQLGRERQVL